MSALTAARKIDQMGVPPTVIPSELDVKLKANAIVFVGGMIAADSTGYGVDPTATTGLYLLGVVESKAGYPQKYDNTGGASGDIVARVTEGVFSFLAGTSGDALTQANMWQPVWVIDDQTVGATDGGATPRSLAGILCGFDPSGRPQVLVSGALNGLILSGSRLSTAAQVVDTIAAAGALSTADITLWSISGTQALTLADGTKLGQRKRVVVVASASTPNGSIAPATPRGFATLTAISGIGSFFDFQWTATGWIPVASRGGTFA
jgi:hypothetical protein